MLNLFLTFFKIGLFTFGGGYAMIPLIKEEIHSFGIDDYTFTDFIAISESSPGPFAVNIATFIGYSNNGVLGALIATFAVILPSYLIILLIAIFIKNLQNKSFFKSFITITTPIVLGLILSSTLKITGLNLFNISNFNNIENDFKLNYITLISFIVLSLTSLIYLKIKKKKISPFIIILLSIVIGILSYLFSFLIQ